MNDLLQQPLRGVAIYNPDLLSKDELIRYFIVRHPLLENILDDMRRQGDKSTPPQHRLIIGMRGMGKTMLLRRLAYAIDDDPELNKIWLPLSFPEEQYNIAHLSDLWVNCIDALGDALERRGHHDLAESLDALVDRLPDKDEPERARLTLQLLIDKTRELDRRLVLLIDNLDIVFDRLKEEHWTIREVIASEPGLLLIGASSNALETTYEYEGAFYDYFKVDELRGLSEEEMREMLRNLAHLGSTPQVDELLDREPARIRTLHTLTGGNPRTIILLYSILVQGIDGDVRNDLERLLDQCTPLYKARFEEFSNQAQQIIDALAIHWDPITAGYLSARLRLSVNNVSSQLNRLEQQGIVEKVSFYPEKKTGFQIAERFFNIWYLMRASRRVRRKLIWLVRFLKMFYDQEQLKTQAICHLRKQAWANSDVVLKHAEYSFSLAQALDDQVWRRALENSALHSLMDNSKLHRELTEVIDLSGVDTEFTLRTERFQQLADICENILNTKIDWQNINPQQFWELLGGTPHLSITEKAEIVGGLSTLSQPDLKKMIESLQEERQHLLLSIRHEETVNKLYKAISRGYMASGDDLEGAEAAVIGLEEPRLKLYALSQRLLKETLDRETSEEAEQAYRQAIELDPKDAYLWNSLGNLYYRLRRYEEAEQAYRQAIELDPKYAPPWNGLGNLLQDHLGRYEEAEQAYRQVITINPRISHPWANLGNLLQYRLGRYEEAEQAYRQAVELDPRWTYPWVNLGNLLQYRFGRYEEAEQAFRMAIKLDPQNSNNGNSLAWLLYVRRENMQEAESWARKALALDPDDWSVSHTLACVLVYLGCWAEAEQHAVHFIKRVSEDFDERIWDNIIIFFREMVATGHAADAVKLLNQTGVGERWRPLLEALQAIVEGTSDYLNHVAPEVRQSALQIMQELQTRRHGEQSEADEPPVAA